MTSLFPFSFPWHLVFLLARNSVLQSYWSLGPDLGPMHLVPPSSNGSIAHVSSPHGREWTGSAFFPEFISQLSAHKIMERCAQDSLWAESLPHDLVGRVSPFSWSQPVLLFAFPKHSHMGWMPPSSHLLFCLLWEAFLPAPTSWGLFLSSVFKAVVLYCPLLTLLWSQTPCDIVHTSMGHYSFQYPFLLSYYRQTKLQIQENK